MCAIRAGRRSPPQPAQRRSFGRCPASSRRSSRAGSRLGGAARSPALLMPTVANRAGIFVWLVRFDGLGQDARRHRRQSAVVETVVRRCKQQLAQMEVLSATTRRTNLKMHPRSRCRKIAGGRDHVRLAAASSVFISSIASNVGHPVGEDLAPQLFTPSTPPRFPPDRVRPPCLICCLRCGWFDGQASRPQRDDDEKPCSHRIGEA